MKKRWGVRKLITAVVAVTAMLAVLPVAARAVDRNWVGGFSVNESEMWYLDDNWLDGSNMGVPVAGDTVYITKENSKPALNVSTPSLGDMQIDNNSVLTIFESGNLTAANTDVGYDAVGTINMGLGLHTVNGDLRLGVNSSSQGNYKIVNDASLSSTNEFVGNKGTGVFMQTGGINHVDFELIVGRFAGSNGTYTLSNGELETAREIVGDAGGLGIFYQSGSSQNKITQDMIIGQDSWINDNDPSGSFYLQDNAILTVTGNVYLGDEDGYGKFEQSGNSESIITNRLIIGGNSEYGLDKRSHGEYYQNGGTNTIGGTDVFGALILGNQTNTFGAYELNDGALIVECEEYIGNFGTGVFVQNGGTHTLNGAMYVGLEGGGYGEYHMTGSGSQLTATDHITMGSGTDSEGKFYLDGGNVNAGYVHVGRNGAGEFEQTGGTLTTDRELVLANDPGSSGTYTLSGDPTSSILMVGGSTFIGMNDEGEFTQDGGTHSISYDLTLGQNSTGQGLYTMTGGNLSVGQHEHVGTSGTGNFNQSGGTHAVAGDLVLANDPGSSGTYTLSGSGSLEVQGVAFIGMNGEGQFNQTGGIINVVNYDLNLAQLSGSTGSYILSETGIVNVERNLYVGLEGTGTFTQSGSDSQVNVTGGVELSANDSGTGIGVYNLEDGELASNHMIVGGWGNGTVNQNGGTNTTEFLFINGDGNGIYNLSGGKLNAADIVMDGIFNYNESGAGLSFNVLSGSGTFVGNLTNEATVSPGDSPGTLTIDGDYAQTYDGSLLIEIGGYTQGLEYDFLNISGTATLAGWLNLNLYDTFSPANNSYFDILFASGGLTGVFEEYEMYEGWKVDYLDLAGENDGIIDTVRVTANSVPVPASMWMLLSGMIGLVGIRRRISE